MWEQGKITVNGETYRYCVKHFEEGSIFGIDNGRISKLDIRRNGEIVCAYERGWDIEATDKNAKKALDFLLKKYN